MWYWQLLTGTTLTHLLHRCILNTGRKSILYSINMDWGNRTYFSPKHSVYGIDARGVIRFKLCSTGWTHPCASQNDPNLSSHFVRYMPTGLRPCPMLCCASLIIANPFARTATSVIARWIRLLTSHLSGKTLNITASAFTPLCITGHRW